MSLEKVKLYFAELGVADKVIELTESSATVELAAKALGCEPARIAKTLSFMVQGNGILVVTAGDMKIDNRKFREYFGEKAKMLNPADVESIIGHSIGGVCPFAIHSGVSVYLDNSLKRFVTVFPAAGSGNSAIELTIPELEQYSESLAWIDVCRLK